LLAPFLILVVGRARRLHGDCALAADFPDEPGCALNTLTSQGTSYANSMSQTNKTRIHPDRNHGGGGYFRVLAATIIPQFMGTTHDAKVSASKSHIAELEAALERFNVHMDRYPPWMKD